MTQASTNESTTKKSAKVDPLTAAKKLGFPAKLAKRLLEEEGEVEFKKILTSMRRAKRSSVNLEDARQKLIELGREGLDYYIQCLKEHRNLPRGARRKQGEVAVSDVIWGRIQELQGIAWAVATVNSTKIVARPDMLVLYNGRLKGPTVKLPRRSGGYSDVHTHGHGIILGPTEYATFGLLPPKGRQLSIWQPCYFEGDPDGQANLTTVKALADDLDVPDELHEIIERLGYPIRRKDWGVPVKFIKRCINDTIKLAGFNGSPQWTTNVVITASSTQKDLESIEDEAARSRLSSFWFEDKAEDEDEEEWEGEELFDYDDEDDEDE